MSSARYRAELTALFNNVCDNCQTLIDEAHEPQDVAKMRDMRSLIPVFLIVIIGIAGCGSNSTPTPVAPSVPPPTATAVQTPEVTSDSGAIVANLVYASDGKPSRSQIFYAAPLHPVKDANGQDVGYLAGLDAVTAQRDESDGNGLIVISRIPPGHYGLAMSTPRGYILLKESPSDKEILFDVVAGQVNNLGQRKIEVDKNLVEP